MLKKFLVFIVFLLGFSFSTAHVQAATFNPVPLSGDSHDINQGDGVCSDINDFCSLRAAIEESNALAGPDIINLPVGTFTLSLGSQLLITSEIVINGADTESTIIQANESHNTATYRVFEISPLGTATISNVKVRNGVCAGACENIPIYGGGLFNAGTLILNHVNISDNIATTYGSVGGGIYNGGTLTIQNGSLIGGVGHGNLGSGGGGGIYNNASITIDNSTVSANFTQNSADGGGIYNDGGNLTIQNGSLIGGVGAGNSVSYPAGGGGIFNFRGGTTIIDASTVSANTSGYIGGGIYSNSTLIIQNNSLIGGAGAGNSAPGGGGIINYGIATIDSSTVTGNYAYGVENSGYGGGGITNAGMLTIQNGSNIGESTSGNLAENLGGGIYNWTGSTVNVINSRILSNTANSDAGGIYNQSGGTVNVTSSCVVGNSFTAFYNLNALVQIATGNWWGAFDGPSSVGSGHGDSVSTNIDFSNFLTTAPTGCDTIYAPPNTPPILNSNQSSITVNEGQTATNSGTVSDPNNDVVALTASVGTVVNNGNGTWSWSWLTNSAQSVAVTITGNDGHGGISQTGFTVNVLDSATVNDFVALGRDGLWLKQGVDVFSGDLGANYAVGGPYLDSGVEVSIGQGVHITNASSAVYGDSVWLKQGAQVNELHYNDRDGNGIVLGGLFTPQSLPVVPALPAVPTFAAGTMDVTVPQNATQTLTSGSYRDLVVHPNATLILSGGIYNFNSWDLRDDAKVYFTSATEVRISNKLGTNMSVKVIPAPGSSIDASNIKIFVTGINGNNGNIGVTPKAAEFGAQNTIGANIYVPNGTLWLKQNAVASGAFLGKWVVIGESAQLTLDSAF